MSYSVGETIEGRVETINPYGIFLRLPNNEEGYIRRRELDLDLRANPYEVAKVGDMMKAIVINLGYPRIELSRRRLLKNPWDEIDRLYHVHDIVQARVTGVASDRVFIELVSGVGGYIPLENLAPWKVKNPQEVVFANDIVEGIITFIDRNKREVVLDVEDRTEQLFRVSNILGRWHERRHSLEEASEAAYILPEEFTTDFDWKIPQDEMRKLAPVLLVDDEAEEALDRIARGLILSGIEAQKALGFDEAEALIKEKPFSVLLLDINLGTHTGFDLINKLPDSQPKPKIIIVSVPDAVQQHRDEIEAIGVEAVFYKPILLRTLQESIRDLLLNSNQALRLPGSPISNGSDFEVYFELVNPNFSADERLQRILRNLVQNLKIDSAILFEQDVADDQQFHVRAVSKDFRFDQDALNDLRYGPIKDVILEQTPISPDTPSYNEERVQKLRNLVDFVACLGIPVYVQDDVLRYTLFLFGDRLKLISPTTKGQAYAAALLVSGVLEAEILTDQVHKLNAVILQGELAGRLMHETLNNIYNNTAILEDLLREYRDSPISKDLAKILANSKALAETLRTIESLRGRLEIDEVKVHETLELAVKLINYRALSETIRIVPYVQKDLPPIRGNAVALQQIILNLILNSIQHIVLYRKKFPKQRHANATVKANYTGLIEISARAAGNVVQIRIRDNGPGIHRNLWERIFSAGFTTRSDGSGLGLNIARSFTRFMGGTIGVEESTIMLGTTFLIEIPFSTAWGVNNHGR